MSRLARILKHLLDLAECVLRGHYWDVPVDTGSAAVLGCARCGKVSYGRWESRP